MLNGNPALNEVRNSVLRSGKQADGHGIKYGSGRPLTVAPPV
jgi:hypothetical protein